VWRDWFVRIWGLTRRRSSSGDWEGDRGQRPPIREVDSKIVTWKGWGVGSEVRALAATRPEGPAPGEVSGWMFEMVLGAEKTGQGVGLGKGEVPIMQTFFVWDAMVERNFRTAAKFK
jgi:hypothetical protein